MKNFREHCFTEVVGGEPQTWYLVKVLVLKVLGMFDWLQRGADVSGAAVWSSGSKVKVRNLHIWLFEAHESSVGVFSVALNLFFYCEMCVIFLCLRVNRGGGGHNRTVSSPPVCSS